MTVDLVSVIGEKRDISVVLDNISFQDDYEGDFATRRALIYTNFTAKTYLFQTCCRYTRRNYQKSSVGLSYNYGQRECKKGTLDMLLHHRQEKIMMVIILQLNI